jgi:excisionase family DNA binding protein
VNAAVNALYGEYLNQTGGDKVAAATLTLASVMLEVHTMMLAPVTAEKLAMTEKAAHSHDQPLTVPEVAQALRVRRSKVLGWIRKGKLKALNVTDEGRPRYRIYRHDLEAFTSIQASLQSPTPRRRSPRRRPLPPVPEYCSGTANRE